jgi:hypothetical protein
VAQSKIEFAEKSPRVAGQMLDLFH